MEIIEDRTDRVPIYCVSATTSFPYLYPMGERSPTDFGDYKLSRYLLKKQALFAHKLDNHYRWIYAEDDYHMMAQYARLAEMQVHASVGYYIAMHPDSAHEPIENVIEAFR